MSVDGFVTLKIWLVSLPEKIELRSKKNSGDFFRVCVGKVYMLINMGVKLPEKTYCHGN